MQRIGRQSENNRDGLHLGHHHDAGRRGGVQDIARIGQADAGASLNRRPDRRVVELGPGAVDRRLVAGDLGLELRDQRALRFQRLLAGELFRRQRYVAFQIAPRRCASWAASFTLAATAWSSAA